MKLFNDLSGAFERIERMNELELNTNPLYLFYRHLTSYPWTIIVPLILATAFSVIAWWLANKKLKKTLNQRFFYNYLLQHTLYIGISILFILIWGILIQHISLFWIIGLIFYGFQVIMPTFLLVVATLAFYTHLKYRPVKDFRRLNKFLKSLGITLSVLILTISYYAVFIEPFNIEVTQHQYNFPSSDLNLRIVHLSDIQTDHLTSREDETIKIVNSLNPDVIVITGDYYNGCRTTHPQGFAAARHVLENIKATYGIYATDSDATCYRDHKTLFSGLPITFLNNKSSKISIKGEDLYIIGVSRRFPISQAAWQQVPPNASKLLIYHGPEIFFDQFNLDKTPDLILVGHTHGGQVGLPFVGALTSGTPFGREYASGWFQKGDTSMYVNRGLGLDGWWAPKIRFFARPEIAIIDVGSKK